jgi:hypothetical protein
MQRVVRNQQQLPTRRLNARRSATAITAVLTVVQLTHKRRQFCVTKVFGQNFGHEQIGVDHAEPCFASFLPKKKKKKKLSNAKENGAEQCISDLHDIFQYNSTTNGISHIQS